MAARKEDSSIATDSSKRKSVKILILGDSAVGKTALIGTYLDLGYIPDDEENVFEQYRARMKYNGNEIDVGLFDLRHGSSAFERRKFYPIGVNSILLCFSIGRYETLKCVYNLWIHEVRAHYGELVPLFLVGLGSDMRAVKSSIQSEDQIVEISEAESIHKRYRFHGDYVECSKYVRKSVVNVINKAFVAAMEN